MPWIPAVDHLRFCTIRDLRRRPDQGSDQQAGVEQVDQPYAGRAVVELKEKTGDATDNPDQQMAGDEERRQAQLKQAGEKAKDAFRK